MLQSFDVSTNPTDGAPRVAALRKEMERLNLDGFLVPRADEHQGEYVPPHAQRLSWLTGFTGSAGMALILKDKAVIFIDGRYTLQVSQETDPNVFIYEDLINTPPAKWLKENTKNLTIGFDPWLHTIAGVKALNAALTETGGKLVSTTENLIDIIWKDQPEPPLEKVSIQPLAFAGKDAGEKLNELQAAIVKSGAASVILTDPSSIAWTFNIRGKDVTNTPFALSFAVIPATGKATLIIDPRKLDPDVSAYLQRHCTLISPGSLEQEIIKAPRPVGLDSQLAAEKIRLLITNANGAIVETPDPARLPRAIKNSAELDGARRAHLRDGVALVRFFAWLDKQKPGTVTEISAAQKLEALRVEIAAQFNSKLEDLSFATISGSGPNGAIIHYRVTTDTNRTLNEGELYLVDSGAQYRDGTTDVTRTVAVGTAGADEKYCFTLVLKGMIDMSLARFPIGTRGMDLDVLARIALWKAGFDYAHGTGHGVGAFLSVHEGPQNLSRRGEQELLPGMIISNEPGYYRNGAFGIRIENLLIVQEEAIPVGGDITMRSFETLTLCPIDQRLIAPELLTQEERNWLNHYHADVKEKLWKHLSLEEQTWLEAATAPL